MKANLTEGLGVWGGYGALWALKGKKPESVVDCEYSFSAKEQKEYCKKCSLCRHYTEIEDEFSEPEEFWECEAHEYSDSVDVQITCDELSALCHAISKGNVGLADYFHCQFVFSCDNELDTATQLVRLYCPDFDIRTKDGTYATAVADMDFRHIYNLWDNVRAMKEDGIEVEGNLLEYLFSLPYFVEICDALDRYFERFDD